MSGIIQKIPPAFWDIRMNRHLLPYRTLPTKQSKRSSTPLPMPIDIAPRLLRVASTECAATASILRRTRTSPAAKLNAWQRSITAPCHIPTQCFFHNSHLPPAVSMYGRWVPLVIVAVGKLRPLSDQTRSTRSHHCGGGKSGGIAPQGVHRPRRNRETGMPR